jgi:hypothetical protein
MTDIKRPLNVFLCHASSDKPAVKKLYKRLLKDGIDAWLDKEKLIPGQNWQIEIPKAVKNSDVVIVCLSSQSITKEGYVQKEIRFALDIADEKPDGTIFIIPARLEDCIVPERLNKFHWVDLFSDNGYEWLLKALQIRADNVGAIIKKVSKSKDVEQYFDKATDNFASAVIDKSKNTEQYLASIDTVFLENGFESIQFPKADKAFYKIGSALNFLTTENYFIFKCVNEALSPENIQSISREIFDETASRMKKNAFDLNRLICYPLIIVESANQDIKDFIKSYNPKHTSQFEFPVIIELSTGNLYYYTGTPLYGFAMYDGIRKSAELLFGYNRKL